MQSPLLNLEGRICHIKENQRIIICASLDFAWKDHPELLVNSPLYFPISGAKVNELFLKYHGKIEVIDKLYFGIFFDEKIPFEDSGIPCKLNQEVDFSLYEKRDIFPSVPISKVVWTSDSCRFERISFQERLQEFEKSNDLNKAVDFSSTEPSHAGCVKLEPFFPPLRRESFLKREEDYNKSTSLNKTVDYS